MLSTEDREGSRTCEIEMAISTVTWFVGSVDSGSAAAGTHGVMGVRSVLLRLDNETRNT